MEMGLGVYAKSGLTQLAKHLEYHPSKLFRFLEILFGPSGA
jgi:hypothetical protein